MTKIDNPPKVLSIMESSMGHGTYGNLLREYFSQSSSCHVDFYWSQDERKLAARVLRRLLSFRFPNKWIQKQNLDFRRFRAQIGNAYMARRLVTRKLSQAEYSAIHFHTYILAFLSIDLMKKLPTVVSLDMTSAQVSRENTDPGLKWTYYPNIFLGKRVFEAASQIVTRSEWARKSVIEEYNIDEKKVKVAYPGINVTALAPAESPKADLQKRFTILFVGGDFKRKGGSDVLEVFLGKFSDTAELNLVTQAPIKCKHSNIHIYDNVKAYTPKWIDLHRQADVFVMPTYNEGFGWVFIEAMAAGLPVIATQINAIPEMVTHKETGFLIQPGDRGELARRIQYLMENPTLSREMGAKGRKVVEQKFNTQTHCQKIESIFREISTFK
jgi:glycosyltransferase involved in cell wall biosynthesis